ncbi:hypothetical protein GGI04_003317 [Coemansia thaxteri]|nr:hypothetical protein GGI04_003317 [Coemansia thaxteri]
MKSITSAIRPRKRRLTNDSTSGSLANAKSGAALLRKEPSKLSASEELPVRLHRLNSASTTTADSITAAEDIGSGVYELKDRMSRRDHMASNTSLDYAMALDTTQSTGRYVNADLPVLSKTPSASLYESMHYQPLYEDAGYDGALPAETSIRRRSMAARTSGRFELGAGSNDSPQDVSLATAAESGAESRSECADVDGRWVDHNGNPVRRYTHEPSLLSEPMVEPSNASFFSSDYGLLKRVSSTPGNLSLFRAHLVDPFSHPEFRAPPRYTRHQPVRLLANEPDDTPLYGYALLVLTSVLFVFSMYSLVVSKFMPYTGIAFLDAVKDDRYYCLLMPITGLSFTFAVFWNWLGMKVFRHN